MLALLAVAAVPAASAAGGGGAPGLWSRVASPSTTAGPAVRIQATHMSTYALDADGMRAVLAGAPTEFTPASRTHPAIVSLPSPNGSFQRFKVVYAPVMMPGLAARHPEIRTYSGRGIDDPTASVRIAMTPLGFDASVRGMAGPWYIDPYFHTSQRVYATYYGRNLINDRAAFTERHLASPGPAAPAVTSGQSSGKTLRIYRLALLSDPTFAAYWGAGNVTSGKVILMTRADQVYEDEFAYRMDLIDHNDNLNLDTPQQAYEPNGPCGTAACFTQLQLSACFGQTLVRNRIVLGQLVGAENYDIGHVSVGQDGGGVAALGVVGGSNKAMGCTGIPQPDGDFYVIDYLTHEMGHQFGMNHPFNGTQGACAGGNRNAPTSYEPGSGSSIMAYAGICGADDLQPHSDPYFTAISYQETMHYTGRTLRPLNEVQTASLRHFGGGDEVQTVTFGPGFSGSSSSFKVSIGGSRSGLIGSGGIQYTNADLAAAINAIAGVGGTVTVTDASDTGFTVTYGGGAWQGTDVPNLKIVGASCGGCFTAVDEVNHGGAFDSFTIKYGSKASAPIINGANYTAQGIEDALTPILPSGATVTVSGFGGGAFTNTGFQVGFGGTLGGVEVQPLALVRFSAGASGFVGETAHGGPAPYNQGFVQQATGNKPPSVTVPGDVTIPYQTPFALTGGGTDPNGQDTTFMWEQFDRGGASGTALQSPTKTNGPLFREFGTALNGGLYDPLAYGTQPCSNGENCVNTDPTRVFPDMAQVLAAHTDAETGDCPGGGQNRVDCFSEFLPTPAYAGPMHFILTTRDGIGGRSASPLVTVNLAAGTGPFLVTQPNTNASYLNQSSLTVKWDVAGTAAAPIGTTRVDILLSTDGGQTFSTPLAVHVRNDGKQAVILPKLTTNRARIEIRAVGNVFFDVSNVNFKITS